MIFPRPLRVFAHALVALFLAGFPLADMASAADDPPPLPREFRAAWVASVGNIDWPSKPGLPTADQKREAISILDAVAHLNLNAVVLQVRPSTDALYDSSLEPWSAFLTGTQGQRPEPYYDPLEFWCTEAHRRGLALHAWFNPYRARYQGAKYDDSATHISKTHPDITKSYGGMLWLDPGEPQAQEHTLKVLLDVVRRYDIDGVHFDDYFYPYPVRDPAAGDAKKELDFPDEPSWRKYRASGGALDRGDWRRQNINQLIERLAAGIKAEKPGVLFGISPFGIPRPGQPEGVIGFDQYDKLYADAVLWLRKGWCDYLSPQLYWKIDAPGQPFRPLLNYWIGANPQRRHIWPGLSVSRVGSGTRGYAPEEILGQIAIIRETPGASGEVLFSMRALLRDRGGIATRLEEGPYREPALIPASAWPKLKPPAPPIVKLVVDGGKHTVLVEAQPGTAPFLWSIQMHRGAGWSFALHPAAGPFGFQLDDPTSASAVAVTAVDRTGNASEPVVIPMYAQEKK